MEIASLSAAISDDFSMRKVGGDKRRAGKKGNHVKSTSTDT